MSLLALTFGRNKERKKSVVGVDLGIIAIDIGVYGKSESKEHHATEHNEEKSTNNSNSHIHVHEHDDDSNLHEHNEEQSTDNNNSHAHGHEHNSFHEHNEEQSTDNNNSHVYNKQSTNNSNSRVHVHEHNSFHEHNKEQSTNDNNSHEHERSDNRNLHQHSTSDTKKHIEGSFAAESILQEHDYWKCRYHSADSHDMFISYRVNTDAELAEKLVDRLHLQNKNIRAFLDKICLPVGENWQTSFLNGLMKSRVLVLLISRSGIENLKGAHERHDNMLLEYEYALQRLSEEGPQKVKLIPVFVGRKITVQIDGVETEVFQKFQFPNLQDFADEPHKTTHKFHVQQRHKLSVREVMRQIFSLQGIFLNDISNLTGLVSELNDVLEKGEHRTV